MYIIMYINKLEENTLCQPSFLSHFGPNLSFVQLFYYLFEYMKKSFPVGIS